MRTRTYGGVGGRKTKVGRKLLRFPPTRLEIIFYNSDSILYDLIERIMALYFKCFVV